MKIIKIVRTEKLKIYPGERQTVHDIKSMINKTQDLTVQSVEVNESENSFSFTVLRELDWYPDTIK